MGGDALPRRAVPFRRLLRPPRRRRRARLAPRHRGGGRGGRRLLRPRRARQPRRRPAAAARRRRGPDPGRAAGGQAAVRARLGALRRRVALPPLHGRQAQAEHERAVVLHRDRPRRPRGDRRARPRQRRGPRRRALRARPRPPARRRGGRLGDRRDAGPRARRAAAAPPLPPRRAERHPRLHGRAADQQPQHAAPVREARRASTSPTATGRSSTSTSSCRSSDAPTLELALRSAATGHIGAAAARLPPPWRTSWVEGADGSGFGLENLPFGAVARGAAPRDPRCGSATTR